MSPATVPKEHFYHLLSRPHCHTSVLARISVAGNAMISPLITANAIRDFPWSNHFSQDEDVMVRWRTAAYVNQEFLFETISDVFILSIAGVPSRSEIEDQPAVLLMKFALPRRSEWLRRKDDEDNIVAITFPAHTAN